MIRFNFNLSWPYKKQYPQKDYIEKSWRISKNKSIDLQLSKWGHGWTLIGFDINISKYRSHSGIRLELELFNYSLIIEFYDSRHWDYKKGEWEKYEQQTIYSYVSLY